MAGIKPNKPIPSGLKFVFGGSAGMLGVCVIHPFDLIKNRMQVHAAKKSVLQVFLGVVQNEGVLALYNGLSAALMRQATYTTARLGVTATVFIQPLDLLKSRMQVTADKKTAMQVFMGVIRNEGVLGLYNGLSAAMLRQATYATLRLGIYNVLFDAFSKDGRPPSLPIKASLGMFAGVTGSFIGNPCDVALIRMSVDGRLPPDQRRNYKNVFNALIRIAKEEGITTWWRGAVPTMGRAMVVNVAQLATYSQAKQMIQEGFQMEECIFLHFCSSFISGLVTATSSLPVDIVKTRLQNMKTVNGVPEYSGIFDVFFRVLKDEGVLALWKGFLPYYMRVGTHTLLIFVFLEQMNSAYRRMSK